MRKILVMLGILLFVDIFYFAFINQGQTLTLNYQPLIDEFKWDSGLLYAFLGLEGGLAAFLITYYYILNLKDKIKKQTRNTEKASIKAQESTDKVKNLQAKVDTLEIALKEALSKK